MIRYRIQTIAINDFSRIKLTAESRLIKEKKTYMEVLLLGFYQNGIILYNFFAVCFFHLTVYHDLCKLVYIHLNLSFYFFLCTCSLYIKEIFWSAGFFFGLLLPSFKILMLVCSISHKNVYTHMWGLMGCLLYKNRIVLYTFLHILHLSFNNIV